MSSTRLFPGLTRVFQVTDTVRLSGTEMIHGKLLLLCQISPVMAHLYALPLT